MNFIVTDYLQNGMVIEDVGKGTILYINKVAKKTLKITDENEKEFSTVRHFVSTQNLYEELKSRIKADMEIHGKSEGIAYLKATDGTFVEIDFSCIWEDEENRILTYIFKNATEVIGESKVIFKELAEHLPSGIVVMDVGNKLAITYANAEHYKILGLEEDSISKEHSWLLRDFIYEEDINWVLSEIHLNLSKNEDVDIEFRMKTKNSDPKWVRLFGRAKESALGEKLFYSSLKDLSQRRSIHDKLHMERILFHKITELTDETLFRVDLHTHILHLLGKPNDIFGEIRVFENYPNSVVKLYEVHEDDQEVHNCLVESFKTGVEKPFEMRFKLGKDEWEWYRITYSFVKNLDGEPISVIGKFASIHKQKLLEEQAKTDLLTGLYNKVTTENETDKLILFSEKCTHAFLIIDIDNFKAINDNLGHHFGDMVLSGIANDIKTCFRKNDIIGRIGGDEFAVVMKDVTDLDMVFEKAKMICSMLSKTYKGNATDYKISASVGISFCPTDGQSYEELYKNADTALYEVKNSGKNGYKQFHADLITRRQNPIFAEVDSTKIKPLLLNNVVTSNVLNLLYETKDLATSLSAILEYIGGIFNVDRCYLFETFDEGNTYSDRYRWEREPKYQSFLEELDNRTVANAFQGANEDGIFYTNDIRAVENLEVREAFEKDDVKSIFLLESTKVANEHIILGLDDCNYQRVWTEEEIVTLLHIGRLIFTAVSNNNLFCILNTKLKRFTGEEYNINHDDFNIILDILSNKIGKDPS